MAIGGAVRSTPQPKPCAKAHSLAATAVLASIPVPMAIITQFNDGHSAIRSAIKHFIYYSPIF